MNPFVLIVGPTASGKSDLALRLAEKYQGAILNCDSLQTYQRMDIGTAKPSLEERARVPHFMFDVLPPGEVLTAGDFRRMAMEVLDRELGARPVFGVGGSGFYIQALEKGMFDVPKPRAESERAIRDMLAERGLPFVFAELKRLDPEYAARLSPNDAYRITRAMIILRDSARTVTELRSEFSARPFPYPLLKLGLAPTREELEPRVRERTAAMLRAGLLEEVRGLVADGWKDWPPLQSVGYKECMQVLSGELPEAKLFDTICEKTLQLSKKQRTWFKRETNTVWLSGADPFASADVCVRDFLADLNRAGR